jgi:methylmalonyl-CoA/ethylmalonyl-CoA epimerase
VEDLATAIDQFTGLFDEQPRNEHVKEQQVDIAMFNVGESRVELLQGTTIDSTISKFVNKYGEGVHHICFEVDDLEESRAKLVAKGFRFVDLPSSRGAHGTRVAFIHPKSAAGVLIELVEYSAQNSSESS